MNQNTPNDRDTIKVPIDELELGMHVSALDRPWLDTPFLFQGFPLEDPDDLATLRNICEYVYIDVLKARHVSSDARTSPVDLDRCPENYALQAKVEEEITKAHISYQCSFTEVEQILDTAYVDKLPDTRVIREHISECVDSIERNPSAMLWLTRIKNADKYTAEHCLNVGLLAIAFGRHLGVGRKHMELLGLCGMLHDVGKMKVDQTILNKPGKLTKEEYEHIKLHVNFGWEILQQDTTLPEEVIAACHHHHERQDGQGYPDQLDANTLGFYTKVVTIVDAYDAITSQRCYSAGTTSAAALKILYDNSGTQFDPKLVVKFIECIGIYPPGALVEMMSGEVGVVISVDPVNRLLPKVALLLDANKNPMQQRIVDLKRQRDLDAERQLRIRKVLMDGSFGVDLFEFTTRNINMQSAPDL
ncbi:HD-GYP domain-containing protein [Ketobacter sp. MCCC 1A13808]|uniref:HD-GYP domain-containing protein n=1 Tax=Ketobacter sp. MCCC 1A13808 TaxID=2602738 RepID=UPI000F23ACEB|nr:HD-GYP domain-containing protein [Ketobacter sp. MCCC 1A13808]MVF14084.1 HD-GYP domain-containing protein [Ketobacter sp. MCCC 1A13808]RLP55110.1 MAG: HD-GYP domain-containing protein [Ketobacter sp.]